MNKFNGTPLKQKTTRIGEWSSFILRRDEEIRTLGLQLPKLAR